MADYRIENMCVGKHPVSFPVQKTFILWKMSKFMKGIPFYVLFSLSLSGPSAVDIFLLEQQKCFINIIEDVSVKLLFKFEGGRKV